MFYRASRNALAHMQSFTQLHVVGNNPRRFSCEQCHCTKLFIAVFGYSRGRSPSAIKDSVCDNDIKTRAYKGTARGVHHCPAHPTPPPQQRSANTGFILAVSHCTQDTRPEGKHREAPPARARLLRCPRTARPRRGRRGCAGLCPRPRAPLSPPPAGRHPWIHRCGVVTTRRQRGRPAAHPRDCGHTRALWDPPPPRRAGPLGTQQ